MALTATAQPAGGPLRVHPTNPRYFTDGTQSADGALWAVYLTGSHVWNNFQDVGESNPPPVFDYNGHLDFLVKHGHNFIRLWRWELTQWPNWKEGRTPLRYGANHPWKRAGPGVALDGGPRFDFSQWDGGYFTRLRDRVRAAGERGIYVSIMLFEGWCLRTQPSDWAGHPMNVANNVSGINGDPDGNGKGLEVQMLRVSAITELQKAYIRRVVDAVNDLDNVLYEISNESLYHPEILKWQEAMVRYVNDYEAGKAKQHPVGMTNLIGYSEKEKTASNADLFAGPAAWVSPGLTIWGPSDPFTINPPATSGKKVEILDTDHVFGNACMNNSRKNRVDGVWVWKAFLRGYNPIYMDPLDLTRPNAMLKYVEYNTAAVLSARTAMGQTRAYAEKIALAAMTPQDALSSTGYCLANAGKEYLVLHPEGGEFTVDLTAAPGSWREEWFDPTTGKTMSGGTISGGGKHTCRPPFSGAAVLYLHTK